MDALKKDEIFRNPESGQIHFGRNISSAFVNGTVWSAMQLGQGKQTTVLALHRRKDAAQSLVVGSEGLAHQPCLAARVDGIMSVTWNEPVEGGWEVRSAQVDTKNNTLVNEEVVFSSTNLCLPPTAAYLGNQLWVAWAGVCGENIKIHVSRKIDGQWEHLGSVSKDGIDCFRPQLAAYEGGIYLAWDQYSNKSYEVVLAEYKSGSFDVLQTLSRKNERWLCPKVIAAPDGGVYLTWVVLKEVIDDLGIIDHFPFAMVAKYQNGSLNILLDKENTVDQRIVADFRDGLLASKIYKGHVGLRRNPFLSICDKNQLWCLWELRKETLGSDVVGYFTGRKLLDDGSWSRLEVFCDRGYCYSIADNFTGKELPITFLKFEAEGLDVIKTDFVDMDNSKPYFIDNSRWNRWRFEAVTPEQSYSQKVESKDAEYHLFWADTHCHSNFSPDADGEFDELVHFGRDVAGLDALCIIDNDYYPHKALTEAEWRIQQEFSRHFTHEGEFVLFSGYEFTYHRSDLDPDFNHRCVIYPRPGGRLLRRIDPSSNTDFKMIAELKKTDGMAYPHHCTYELVDGDVEWNVEVCSSWRVCLEETDFTIQQLKKGKRIGFVGSSDTHRAVPGLGGAMTGLYAKDLSRESLFDAYRNRRCIATQGAKVLIDFRVNETFIGSQATVQEAPKIEATVKAHSQIEFVEIVRDGRAIHRETCEGCSLNICFVDEELSEGEHFYFLRVKLVGDPSFNIEGNPKTNPRIPFSQDSRYPHNLARARGVFAWTSPIWISRS